MGHRRPALTLRSAPMVYVGRWRRRPNDVIKFEAVELVLQPSDFLAVRSHLGVVAAGLLHDLVDDQLGVTSDVEALDAQLDGDA